MPTLFEKHMLCLWVSCSDRIQADGGSLQVTIVGCPPALTCKKWYGQICNRYLKKKKDQIKNNVFKVCLMC